MPISQLVVQIYFDSILCLRSSFLSSLPVSSLCSTWVPSHSVAWTMLLLTFPTKLSTGQCAMSHAIALISHPTFFLWPKARTSYVFSCVARSYSSGPRRKSLSWDLLHPWSRLTLQVHSESYLFALLVLVTSLECRWWSRWREYGCHLRGLRKRILPSSPVRGRL